jgi:hypothetical protein
MPRTLHIYPVNPSDIDYDTATRAVMGEDLLHGALGEQMVAGTMRNRALLSGKSITDIVRTGRYDGYKGAVLTTTRSSPVYQSVRANIESILNGSARNPAGNATAYYAPKWMKKDVLGRPKAPKWATDQTHVGDFGDQRFYAAPFPAKDSIPLPPSGFAGSAVNLKPEAPGVTPGRPAPRAMEGRPSTLQSAFAASQPSIVAPQTPAPADSAPLGDFAPTSWPGSAPMTAPPDQDKSQTPVQPGTLADIGRLQGGAPQGGLPTDMGDYLYGPGDPDAGAATAATGGKPPSPYDSPPGVGASDAQVAPDGAVRPEDIANLGYENAHILARLLGRKPSPPPAPSEQDPTQAMLVAALMARSGYHPDGSA